VVVGVEQIFAQHGTHWWQYVAGCRWCILASITFLLIHILILELPQQLIQMFEQIQSHCALQ